MFYTIYKITNTINGKIYIGQHATEDLNDGYMGSGTKIVNAIRKYGNPMFKKEILFIFDSYDEMNQKEIDIVDSAFIKRRDTYNIVLGGVGWRTDNTVVVRLKAGDKQYYRIHSDEFYSNRDLYETLNDNKLWIIEDEKYIQIDSSLYDSEIHTTPSTGRISVIDLNGITSSILKKDLNSNTHKSVFGGIVVSVNGKRRYASKEEFYNSDLVGIYTGKVTARNLLTCEVKHIDKVVFDANPDLYEHISTGRVTGKHKITGEKKEFKTSDKTGREDYNFATTGQRTVFSTIEKKFINIYIKDFNKNIHKMATDVKFNLISSKGDVILTYWGSKKNFLLEYDYPACLWQSFLKNTVFHSRTVNNRHLNGIYFEKIDWKLEYELK